jgi:hypothetical protein
MFMHTGDNGKWGIRVDAGEKANVYVCVHVYMCSCMYVCMYVCIYTSERMFFST